MCLEWGVGGDELGVLEELAWEGSVAFCFLPQKVVGATAGCRCLCHDSNACWGCVCRVECGDEWRAMDT